MDSTDTAALTAALHALAEATTMSAEANRARSRVLNSHEAAELLRVSEEAVRRGAASGDIPARLIDGDWRFNSDALLAWLANDRRRRPGDSNTGMRPRVASTIEWAEETLREADDFMARMEELRQADEDSLARPATTS